MSNVLHRATRRFAPEVVFEAHVDYAGDAHLTEEDSRVEGVVMRTLTSDLPEDLRRFFDLEITVRIKGTRYGSLSVFFGVLVAGYGLLSGYKGIYDSIELIQSQASALLSSRLRGFGRFNVSVSARFPEAPSRKWERFLFRELPYPFPLAHQDAPLRDGFFYFLLVVAIVEAAIIAGLVYGAVAKTYFGS